MRRKGLFVIASLISAFILAGVVSAAEFQADMLMDGLGQKVTGKVYVKGELMRQEMNTPMGNSISISDGENSIMYVIMPDQKMYMEMPLEQQLILKESISIEEALKDEAELKKLGSENIEGYKCEKYEIRYKDPDMGVSTAWISQKLNYPLKVISKTSEGTLTMLYTNIREGSVDQSLFRVPSGYKKLSGF